MKIKLVLLMLSCLFVVPFPHRGTAQIAESFVEDLTATYSSSPEILTLSWWAGEEPWSFQIQFTEDLDSMEWVTLPDLFPWSDAPTQVNFAISGSSSDRRFYRLIRWPFFAKDSNMLIHDIRFIGNEEMRTYVTDGLSYFPNDPENFIDEGMLFSNGLAAAWNMRAYSVHGHPFAQSYNHNLLGDTDLNHWMLSGGFGWELRDTDGRDQFSTRDAAGIEIDFQVDPSVAAGRVFVSYLFASEEYYMPALAHNDPLGIFIAELDSSGEPILETQVNLGRLEETQTYSSAINVYNVGDIQVVTPDFKLPPHSVNLEQSGFVNNSPKPEHHDELQNPPPYAFGYAGFTSRLAASGGVAIADADIDVRTRLRQANVVGVGDDMSITGEKGWGGILFRGSNRLLEEEFYSDLLSGYVAAFGLNSGSPEFTLYKVMDLDVNNIDAFIIPNDAFGTFPSDFVEVLASAPIVNFDANAWYWIRVKAEGDNILAKIWRDGETEPSIWTIDYTDASDPIESGFLGLIHPDTFANSASEVNDMRWDIFEVLGPGGVTVDFSEHEPGKYTPPGWSTVGYGRNASEWEVIDDSGSTGGRHIRHRDDHEPLSVLRFEGPGTVEGGKSYRLKIVVADMFDPIMNSAILIEGGSIRVIPE